MVRQLLGVALLTVIVGVGACSSAPLAGPALRERAVTHFEGDRSNGAAALRRELSGYPYPGFMRAAGLLWATGMAGTGGEWDSAAHGSRLRT